MANTPGPYEAVDLDTYEIAQPAVAASGTAQTIPDPTTGHINLITLTGNCTFTFPAAAVGYALSFKLTQDATGSRTVTWPSTVKWASATAPTLSTAAGKIDYVNLRCYDGTTWVGSAAILDVR